MEELEPGLLLARVDDLFLRHRMDPRAISRAWLHGGSFATVDRRSRYGTTLTVLGDPDDGAELLYALAERVSVDRVRLGADIVTSDDCRFVQLAQWDWMLTRRPAPEPEGVDVLDVRSAQDRAAINALLDSDNPDAHGRPGDTEVAAWAGIWDGSELAAVGALERTGDGSGHLRSVTTRRDVRGRGRGGGVSALLTNMALDGASRVASLGVFCDNDAARRVYQRLGYRVERTLKAGRFETL